MTIDNHPLTPKPVDDREAGVGYHQMYVAHADSIAARQIAQWAEGLGRGSITLVDFVSWTTNAIARHREQAERGLREALEAIADGKAPGRYLTLVQARSAARKALDTRP